MKTKNLFASLVITFLFGCSNKGPSYPSAEGKPYPYIHKIGCEFSIVEERSKASISSPKVEGMPGAEASASITLGELSITVSNCMVEDNPHGLPIYED
jgi:hypothetical protein